MERLLDHPELGKKGRWPGTRELVNNKYPQFNTVYTIQGKKIFINHVLRACQPESNLVQPDRNIVQIAITPSEPIQNTAEEFHQQLKDAEVHSSPAR